MIRKITSLILSLGLLFQQTGLVYAVGELNLATYLSSMPRAIIQPDHFRPPQLRFISYDLKSNDFKLLLDKGDAKQPNEKSLTQELLNYFLIGLSLPNDTFWVNLRPDAADNIIDPLLEKTDIGKIFLEADLQLKKDTASFTSPQNPEGKQYWDKLYKKAGELFGTENITIPTITRPWIVPNEVIVRETDDSAYIYKATLKVMLEEDYLRGMKDDSAGVSGRGTINYSFNDPRLKELNEYSTQLIKESIIPKLTKEVNSSRRYAKLRQVYYSLVLSRWFKARFRSQRTEDRLQITEKPDNYIKLIDTGDLTNLTSKENWDKTTYFSQYQESFAKGEYNLKETITTPFGQSIRSYVSGGVVMSASPIKPGSITVQPNKYVDDALKGQPATIANSSLLTLAEIKTEISEAVEKGVIGITPDERKGLENNTVSFNQLSNMALKMEYSINQKQHLERWNKIWKWLIQMARYESEIIRFANAFERKSILTPLESKEIDGHIERNGLIFAANKFSSLSRDTLYSHEMEWAFIQLAEEIRKFSETGSLPGERNSALIRLQESIKDMPDVKSILKKYAIGVSVGSPLINPVVKESLFESVKGGARIRFDELERILAGQISRMQEYFASDFIKERFKKLKKAKSYEDKKGILLNYINISGWKEIKVSPEMEAELEDFLLQCFREYYLNAAIEVRDKFSAKDED